MPSQRSRLVLVGGGHAHLEILRRQIEEADLGVDLTLASLEAHHVYSGMLPGLVAGQYRAEQLSFDLARLVERCGGEFVRERVTGIRPDERVVLLESGRRLPYDLVSFNVGSRLLGDDRPEISGAALLVKPLTRVHAVRDHLQNVIDAGPERRVVVVGGGAAGVEIAFAARTVLGDAADANGFSVSILDGASQILSGYRDDFRRRALQVLANRSIEIRTGVSIERVADDHLVAEGGEQISSELTIWLTGPASVPVFEGSGLATDERGFLLVDDSLRSIDDRHVFAVGDCATMANFPQTAKAGVYAVRQGPVLWESLKASLTGGEPPRYRPQGQFLSILNSCDGKALLQYKRWISYSRAAWLLKDWIDRRFMRRYHGAY